MQDENENRAANGEGPAILPSEYMRQARPEYYSDSESVAEYDLSSALLDQQLDTITARNQTHDFEVFCRKLCERVICPNLKPATGPEGGGDSKADTETIAVAEEIAELTYIGDANAASERWAFAFSAKKTWKQKARSDIGGLAATGRGYAKVFFVTSQYARARDRAALEDELSKAHGFRVEILDRSWILAKIIEGGNPDLAFDYLGVGREVAARRLGPVDYGRDQRLTDLEKSIQDPQAYEGMESQRAMDALVAAKLSRGLERPRFETDGRFDRATRLADAHGLFRQKLEARYERLWTAFYWFDDIALLNAEYDAFETMAFQSDAAKNLEFVCNLLQNLFTVVMHGHLTAGDVDLDARARRLSERLEALADDPERLNNALEARASLLIVQVNQAMLSKDKERLSRLWPEFSDVLRKAEGLTEFSADRVVRLIEVFGTIAGNDPAYRQLVDDLAAFVSHRTGEAQGGLILLKRAQQLEIEDAFEIIRLLGKATRQLAKKEYASELVEATYLLSVAYRSCGMPWAARVNAMFAITTLFVEAEEDGEPSASIIPALLLLAWIDIELRHLPELLDTIRLLNGCRQILPLDDESKARLSRRLDYLDVVLATQMLNMKDAELGMLTRLPDVLRGLDLIQSQAALTFGLGHADALLTPEEQAEGGALHEMLELFTSLAAQPSGHPDGRPLVVNAPGEAQTYESRVLGMRVVVLCSGSDASVLVAEAMVGAIEAFFATTLASRAGAHIERFEIAIDERAGLSEPSFDIDANGTRAVLAWPEGLWPTAPELRAEIHHFLLTSVSIVFGTTCIGGDIMETIDQLCTDDALLERLATVVTNANSRQRSFVSAVSRIATWDELGGQAYPVRADRPRFESRKAPGIDSDSLGSGAEPSFPSDHRKIEVRSVIDFHLWTKADWTGVFFAVLDPRMPPVLGLHFKNREAAREIFRRWRERFGERDLNGDIHLAIIRDLPDHPPAHYATLVTSSFGAETSSDRIVTTPARVKTLEPATAENLTRFLEYYAQAGCYLLAPAVFDGDAVDVQQDLMILKRELPVKRLDDITETEVETIAVRLLRSRD